MITELIGNVVIELDALPEPASIEGNCSAIDPETDRETAEYIQAALDAGNRWAWCCVQVTAALPGIDVEGTAYLGCCSYGNAKDFMIDGYYDGMVLEALQELASELPDHDEIAQAISIVGARQS